MTTKQFAYLSELVGDIKAMGDPAIAAIACRALSELLDDDARWKEEIGA
jgi:hypothetical protein